MAIGFILINTSPGHEHEVYNKLSQIQDIVEIHPIFGEFDIMVKIKASELEELGKIVVNKIRSLEGVIDTKTLLGTKF